MKAAGRWRPSFPAGRTSALVWSFGLASLSWAWSLLLSLLGQAVSPHARARPLLPLAQRLSPIDAPGADRRSVGRSGRPAWPAPQVLPAAYRKAQGGGYGSRSLRARAARDYHRHTPPRL